MSAEYSGTITQTSTSQATNDILKANLSWKMRVSGPVDQIAYPLEFGSSAIHWKLEQLNGEVKDQRTGGSCTGAFGPAREEGALLFGIELPLEEPGVPVIGGNPETNPDYTVTPPGGLPSSLISDKVTETGGDPACLIINWDSNGSTGWGGPAAAQNSSWTDTVEPKVYFPVGGEFTKQVNFSCAAPNKCVVGSGATFNATITSTIAFSSFGPPLPGSQPILRVTPPSPEEFGPPVPFDWLPESKRNARLDLDPALENARNYCTPFALGLAGFGTGVLLSGAPGIGATLTVAGSLTALASEPFCVATLRRVADDVKRYRDPPDSNIHAIARPPGTKPSALPSCGRRRGAAARFCKRLRAAESKWVQATERAASIDDALSTTTNRESAALTAGDRGAIAAQSAAGQQLQIQEDAALSEKTMDGRAAAAILRSGKLRFKLSKAQSRVTIKDVEHSLARQGIPTSTLTTIGSPALNPQAVDLLAALAR